MKKAISICVFAMLAACTVSSPTQTTPIAATSAATGVVTGFSADINAFRASQGLPPLRPNSALNRAAQAHAQDMSQRGYFAHRSPGGPNGDTFIERARSSGCAMRSGAENIASGQVSELAALESWKASSGHRRNMLGRSYTEYGLGRSGNIWVLKLAASC